MTKHSKTREIFLIWSDSQKKCAPLCGEIVQKLKNDFWPARCTCNPAGTTLLAYRLACQAACNDIAATPRCRLPGMLDDLAGCLLPCCVLPCAGPILPATTVLPASCLLACRLACKAACDNPCCRAAGCLRRPCCLPAACNDPCNPCRQCCNDLAC